MNDVEVIDALREETEPMTIDPAERVAARARALRQRVLQRHDQVYDDVKARHDQAYETACPQPVQDVPPGPRYLANMASRIGPFQDAEDARRWAGTQGLDIQLRTRDGVAAVLVVHDTAAHLYSPSEAIEFGIVDEWRRLA